MDKHCLLTQLSTNQSPLTVNDCDAAMGYGIDRAHRHPPLVHLWPLKQGGDARKPRNSNNGCHSPFSFPPPHHPLHRYHIINHSPRLLLGERYMLAPGMPRCLNENCLTLVTNIKSLCPINGHCFQPPTREQGHRHPLPNRALANKVPVRPPTISLSDRIYCSFSACMECRNLTSPLLPVPHAKRHLLARTRTAKYAWMD